MLRRSILTGLVLITACAPARSDGRADFCPIAVEILMSAPGDDPSAMDLQMQRLEETAELLSDGDRRTLESLTQPVRVTLAEVLRSDDSGGWSDVAVVEWVTEICDAPDLIGWTIQP